MEYQRRNMFHFLQEDIITKMQPYYRKNNNLNESYYYQIFNEAAMSANTPLNDASPIQQQMIQDKIAEMQTSLADKAKAFLKNNWKVLTVGAALLALSAGYMYRNEINNWMDPKVNRGEIPEDPKAHKTNLATKATTKGIAKISQAIKDSNQDNSFTFEPKPFTPQPNSAAPLIPEHILDMSGPK